MVKIINWEDLLQDDIPWYEQTIEELETKLQYTKKTVRRKILLKNIRYWKQQLHQIKTGVQKPLAAEFKRWRPL